MCWPRHDSQTVYLQKSCVTGTYPKPERSMKEARFHQIPYIEVSIFSSIIALTLSYFFYQARLGMVNSMTGDLIKTLGISLLLLNLPPAIAIFFRYKSQSGQLPWYQSQASVTLLTLLIITVTGFIIKDNNYYLDYGLSITGYIFFSFHYIDSSL